MFLSKTAKLKSASIGPLDLVNIKDILGCFCYIFSNNVKLTINRIERGYGVGSFIIDFCEDSNRVAVKTEKDIYFKLNENISVSFVINSVRYSFHTFINSIRREGEVSFKLPSSVHYDDKRLLTRVALPDGIENSVELVAGYLSGLKVNGTVNDLSLGGLSFAPNAIESVKNFDALDLKESELKEGDKFRTLKLCIDKDILKCSGVISRVPSVYDSSFGVKFLTVKPKYCEKIREYVQAYSSQKRFINFSTFYSNSMTIN